MWMFQTSQQMSVKKYFDPDIRWNKKQSMFDDSRHRVKFGE